MPTSWPPHADTQEFEPVSDPDPTVETPRPATTATTPTTPAGGPPPPPPPPVTGSADRGRRLVPVLAAAVLSAVLASGATVALVDEDPAPVEAATSSTEADDAAATVPVPVVDSDEPVAVAAATVAPAVVQIETRTGVGSGVVYDESGLVLTVAHVVGDSSSVDVRLADGSTVPGQVVGTHPETDVAVVRIDADDVTAVAQLATGEEPQVGQTAVAVGSPFGLDQTVTSGIISAVNRVVNDVTMVQTDAAINPGNSGGPLVDLAGRVIGLSDLIYSESGGNQGIGFAIHVDVAKIVADQLVDGETPRLALLGVSTTDTADGARGAQVAEVVGGSAADDAGIEVGDLIVSVDGTPVADGGQLRAVLIRNTPGTEVVVGVERDGDQVEIPVTLGSTG